MLELSNYLHNAALLLVALSLVANILVVATRARRAAAGSTEHELVVAGRADRELAGVGPGRGGRGGAAAGASAVARDGILASAVPGPPRHGVGWFADRLAELALLALTGALVLRMLVTGHAPFANQYEFATAFVWAVLGSYVYFEWRYRIRGLALLVLPIALTMLLYSSSLERAADPLIPALQNSLLLTLHVLTAVIGYGAAAISFAAAVLFLVRDHIRIPGVPSGEVLEEVGYRAVVLTFPMLTMMLILGALWADIAWGRYWSWDPKETAALVTWLIYGAYLHARVMAGWRGNRAAWLLVLGFAAVVFTFLGNHWFGGLHSYA